VLLIARRWASFAERERRGHTTAVGDTARRDDGHADGVDDLRHEREGADERLLRGLQERDSVPGRLGSARDDRIDARLVEGDGLRDGRRGADHADPTAVRLLDQRFGGNAEHHGERRGCRLPDRVELLLERRHVRLGTRRDLDADGGVEGLERLRERRVLGARCRLVARGQPDVERDRLIRGGRQLRGGLADPLAVVAVEAIGPETAGVTHRGGQLDGGETAERTEQDRAGDAEELFQRGHLRRRIRRSRGRWRRRDVPRRCTRT
jgi:hypothetical protein